MMLFRHTRLILSSLLYLCFAILVPSHAESLLFDGDFESGTFQGWTPGGENDGFATLAAKGTCYSGNDTTAISFNGDPSNNYAALLRSNSAGDPGSIAKLRSANFSAGNGILFSALSETGDANASKTPVNLAVRILDSEGKVLSELPLQTAVIQLGEGCNTSKRDTAFSVHYIDTRLYNGEISIEFTQHTNTPGFSYFTLIDNVIKVDKGELFLNQTQPIAVAGTSLSSSNILFLDPRESLDPDNLPLPLKFSWFINGEETIRLFDLPCINLNADAELAPGNHVATLYATDGINYAADTLRFVVGTPTTTTAQSSDTTTDTATNPNITLTTPKGEPITGETNLVSGDGLTQTDPQNECDIDVTDTLEDSESQLLSIDVDSNSDDTFDVTFTVGGSAVSITSNAEILSSEEASIVSMTISIDNPESEDTLSVTGSTANLSVSGDGTTSITITPTVSGTLVSDSEFETLLESIEFDYVPAGAVVTDQRTLSYSVTDSIGSSATTSSTVTVAE